jgi:NAD(P)-dependent dehydrogenase (short-subunit alcohol dehydrogenase family)
VTAVQGDVANLADLDRVYQAIKAEKGRLDIVVANAGFVEKSRAFEAQVSLEIVGDGSRQFVRQPETIDD